MDYLVQPYHHIGEKSVPHFILGNQVQGLLPESKKLEGRYAAS